MDRLVSDWLGVCMYLCFKLFEFLLLGSSVVRDLLFGFVASFSDTFGAD